MGVGGECVTIGIVKDRDCSFSITGTQTTEHERTDLSTRERLSMCVCVQRALACFALCSSLSGDVYVIKLNVYICVLYFGRALNASFLFPRPGSTSAWMCHTLLQPGDSVLPYMCLAGKVTWPGGATRPGVLYAQHQKICFQAFRHHPQYGGSGWNLV